MHNQSYSKEQLKKYQSMQLSEASLSMKSKSKWMEHRIFSEEPPINSYKYKSEWTLSELTASCGDFSLKALKQAKGRSIKYHAPQ